MRAVLGAAAACLIIALSLADLHPLLAGGFGLGGGAYLLALASHHADWPRAASWRALRWDGERWLLRHRRSGWVPVELRESVTWPGVTALRFRGKGRGSIRLLMSADTLTADEHRRLRLHLRSLPVHGRRQ